MSRLPPPAATRSLNTLNNNYHACNKQQMNRTTELPTTKETTTDPTTIIMGTPFLVVRKSDAVKTQYENSVKKSRQKMK